MTGRTTSIAAAVGLALAVLVGMSTGSAAGRTPSPVAPDRDVPGGRVAVRTVAGSAEFYLTGTGERFTPRGVNYLEFLRDESGDHRDAVFATDTFDRSRIRQAFEALADRGYNTARIFIDTCGRGRHCIGNPDGPGLNPGYLDNIATTMELAREMGIRLLLTANSLPDDGGYWERFDAAFVAPHPGFTGRENADWLHEAGVAAKAAFWTDLVEGLADRDAPFEVLLGWQLTNEFWLHRALPPMSLDAGQVTTANGRTYDMADPRQKRRMVIDGVVHFIDRIRPIIAARDPEGLVTMGFFAPAFQPEWYVDTAPLLERADLDFFDFHAYADTELTAREQAASFGMIGFQAKPVLMGETGVGRLTVPTATAAIGQLRRWIRDSCRVGWDGWLNWGYHPWPDGQPGAAWALLDADGALLEALSPAAVPDPCADTSPVGENVALRARARASASSDGRGADRAVDGTSVPWSAGDVAPQTLTLDLRRPAVVGEIDLAVDQWPPGVARHRVWATLDDGRRVLVADLERFLHPAMTLAIELDPPLPAVIGVAIETLRSPSWVAWREIGVLSASPGDTPCLVAGRGLRVAPDAPAALAPALPPGTWVLAEARSADGAWLRLPGDRWMRASDRVCPGLPRVDGPRLDLVAVRFVVRVPAGSGEVFLAGDLGSAAGLPLWDPGTALLAGSGRRRTLTLPLPRGAEIEYKFDRGARWEGVEKGAGCVELPNRRLRVDADLVVRDRVETWADAC